MKETALRALNIQLAPHSGDGSGFVDHMDVVITVERPDIQAEKELFFLNSNTVTIPFCAVPGGFDLSDADGPVAYTVRQEVDGFLEREHYSSCRAISGDLVVRYRALARVQPEGYRSSPYFDLVSEEGGVNGAGVTFLPQFGSESYRVSLQWDLSEMPEGSIGVWCMQEGNFENLVIAAKDICFSYYAAGLLHSIKQDNFAFYWLSKPPFPIEAAAEKIQTLFLYMADFFRDTGEPYKVFARKNRSASQGGTAGLRSYLFGYNEKDAPTVDSLLNLFAHEMVHNWPKLEDEPYGTATWYPEGTAEYYSVVLPSRAGLTTPRQALEQLNKKTGDYYSNPKRGMSNAEAAKEFWNDRRVQRIPYGRGMLYIINTDARIRRASDGRRCVDDVVLAILRRTAAGEKCGNEVWLELVGKELGCDETPAFEQAMSGERIVPEEGCFNGAFAAVEHTFDTQGESGVLLSGYQWALNPEWEGNTL